MYIAHSAAALVYQQIKEIKFVIVFCHLPKILLVAYSLFGKEMVTSSFS